LPALCLREGDHGADLLDPGHQRDQAIETERDSAVRWRAIGERVEKKAEFPALILGRYLERAEDLGLHLLAVNAHRSAADLPTIQHDVVGLGERSAWVGLEELLVTVLGCGERMVARAPARRLVAVFEHGEIDYPQRLPSALRQAAVVADFRAHGAQRVVDDLFAVG